MFGTSWNVSMERTNPPFRKENDLNHTSIFDVVSMLIFQGCVTVSSKKLPLEDLVDPPTGSSQ